VSLFVDSSFLVFSEFEYGMISIDVLYPFERIIIAIFSKKKRPGRELCYFFLCCAETLSA
jgi:hypothetical protein